MADPRRFRPVATELVRRARQAADPAALALALRALAWAERARLADTEAKRLLDEAARIARRHGLDQIAADVLMSRAAVNQELGRITAARRDLDAAGPIVAPDRAAELAFQRAVLHQNIGRLVAAAAAYRGLLARAGLPERTRVIAANNLSMIDAQHGRYADALRLLDDAARRARELGPALVALVAGTRAWVTVHAGRLVEGLRLFDEAAAAHEAAGLPLGEHYVEYADALMDLRLIPEASVAARSAVEVFRHNGVPLMGAEAQLRVAQLALLGDDPDAAEAASDAAARDFARQRRGAWRARAELVRAEARLRLGVATAADLRAAARISRTLAGLGTRSTAVPAYTIAGRIAAALGRTRDAVALLERAAGLARGSPVLVRLRGDVAAAMAAGLRHDDGAVLRHCRRGLADLARHRTALPSVELRAHASGHGAELGQLGLGVMVRGGSATRVLDWMERTRAAALLTAEPTPEPAPDAAVGDALDELRGVAAELAQLSTDRAAAGAPGPLLARQRTIENRIRRATWHGDARSGAAAAVVPPARLRELLAGRVLVEYGVLHDRLVAVVVGPRRSRLVALGPLAPVLDQVRALFFALRRMTQPMPESSLAAARLSADLRVSRLTDLLIRPLGVPAGAELVVVPVGHLHGIPWSALHDAPLSLAPSARFWARTREAARAHVPRGATVLVEGPDLPGATAEVRRLRALHPDATVVTPPGSTAQEVLRLLGGADLAHLACHGRLRSDNPLFSSLVLSDGPLTVQELETRGAAPHRLVLASCQSGADVSYAGDEVVGFISSLLARGTAGVVASVAAVPDVAAADLMTALHERLATGGTLARALYDARAGLDRTAPDAYVNWCTFSAYGAA
ncbi:CHAT domain-containing protein [Spirilliplanes yamanashiensis]|uniref:CHAT domain-containing protein n=1 Tax=Spirilliplanes yamanashiensis TaxID=42233 RepID=A0A8J4DJ43_9ACTN|nr:CHAT domain-containing protein [Spirilliplanes yamanashiensis]MDP9817484.1 tetratricopeptide (TPR) repeat protein [Spirilliplanes yamanashiensis]GIJ02863.1 CHAT domain-containing protein [Spirilliplanes yamanashiensis]